MDNYRATTVDWIVEKYRETKFRGAQILALTVFAALKALFYCFSEGLIKLEYDFIIKFAEVF